MIGIRLTLYFPDDVSIVQQKLMEESGFDHISKDDMKIDEFRPVRCNLTFRFENQDLKEVEKIIDQDKNVIDAKYEIQLRTVLSEGWHEVEHDLRYKCKSEWDDHSDLNRNMNGILASLETSEFSMLQLFNELAHRHYKEKNIEAMIKSQFRIRFSDVELDNDLAAHFKSNESLVKDIHRIPRQKVLEKLINSRFPLPLTLNHFIYLLNYLYLKDEKIFQIAGEFVTEEIESSFVTMGDVKEEKVA